MAWYVPGLLTSRSTDVTKGSPWSMSTRRMVLVGQPRPLAATCSAARSRGSPPAPRRRAPTDPSPVLGPVPDLRDGAVRLLGFPRVSSTGPSTTPKPRSCSTTGPTWPAATKGWAPSGPERQHPTGPQPQDQRSRRAVRRRQRRHRHDGPGRHDHDRGHDDGEVVQAYTSLNGTQMNCSGGDMPWGSWITCEETVNGSRRRTDFTGVSNVPLTKPHGYRGCSPSTVRMALVQNAMVLVPR